MCAEHVLSLTLICLHSLISSYKEFENKWYNKSKKYWHIYILFIVCNIFMKTNDILTKFPK